MVLLALAAKPAHIINVKAKSEQNEFHYRRIILSK